MRSHNCFKKLPKDCRTFSKSNRNKLSLLPIGEDGFYWHIGLIKSLTPCLLQYDDLPVLLLLELNTDGISLTRSDPRQFWPIQVRVINIPKFKPMMIGLFKGYSKPADVFLLFEFLINEVQESQKSGGILINNRRIPLKFDRFISDGPAEAMVLNHRYPTAFEPCSKCHVVGYKYKNKSMVYIGIKHKKRESKKYKKLEYKRHQLGNTPLHDLNIDPINQVPFDTMHVVYHRVVPKCEQAWFLGKYGPNAKLKPTCREEISERYGLLDQSCPSEFSRRPRNLLKKKKDGTLLMLNMKATEWRHFVLYAAPVVLFGVLSDQYYKHFLLLHIAMRIVVSENIKEKRLKLAERCIKTFVKFAPKLYSPRFVSFVVHCLLHLVDDVRKFGPADDFSCFIYENNNNFLKKLIKNHPKPLQQFANRLQEWSYVQYKVEKPSSMKEKVQEKHEHGTVPHDFYNESSNSQYKKFKSASFEFVVDGKNNFCQLQDGSICQINNIIANEERILFYVSKFHVITDFYEQPIKSSTVGVYKCSLLSDVSTFHLLEKISKELSKKTHSY